MCVCVCVRVFHLPRIFKERVIIEQFFKRWLLLKKNKFIIFILLQFEDVSNKPCINTIFNLTLMFLRTFTVVCVTGTVLSAEHYTKNVERSCICWRCLVTSKMVNIFNLCNHTRSAVQTIWIVKRCFKSRKKTNPHIFWWICFFFRIQFAHFSLINNWWRRRLIELTKSWTIEGKSYGMLNLPKIVRHIREALCHTELTKNRTHPYVKHHSTLNSPKTGHTHTWSIVPHGAHQKTGDTHVKQCSTLNSPKTGHTHM